MLRMQADANGAISLNYIIASIEIKEDLKTAGELCSPVRVRI